jgi:hypothetical protein
MQLEVVSASAGGRGRGGGWLGDVRVAVQAQQADGQAPQRSHDAGRVPGPDQGLVFLVGDVADPVELVLDVPVSADPGR